MPSTPGGLPHTAGQTTSAEETELAAHLAAALADPVRDFHALPAHAQAALGDHVDDVDDAEGGAAEGAEDGDGGDGPEDEFQVEVVADVGAVVHLADGHGQDGVGDHPRHHHVRAHRSVVVFLLLRLAGAFFEHFEPVTQVAQRFVVAGVDVELFARHLELDCVSFSGHGGS